MTFEMCFHLHRLAHSACLLLTIVQRWQLHIEGHSSSLGTPCLCCSQHTCALVFVCSATIVIVKGCKYRYVFIKKSYVNNHFTYYYNTIKCARIIIHTHGKNYTSLLPGTSLCYVHSMTVI